MGKTVTPRKRGRPKGSTSHKQFVARLRKLRQAVDPRGHDPFWRKLEGIVKEHQRLSKGRVQWLKLTRDVKDFMRLTRE